MGRLNAMAIKNLKFEILTCRRLVSWIKNWFTIFIYTAKFCKWHSVLRYTKTVYDTLYFLKHQQKMAYNNNNNDRLTAFDPGQPG